MSQIRRQIHFGAVKSEERYYIDTDLLREIKQHLKQQQEDLSHLISIIKDDLENKLVEHGLNETIYNRGGVFSWHFTNLCYRFVKYILLYQAMLKNETDHMEEKKKKKKKQFSPWLGFWEGYWQIVIHQIWNNSNFTALQR